MSKRRNYTTEELMEQDRHDNAVRTRQEAFASGKASEVLTQWDNEQPSYEELLVIVRNMLQAKADKE